MVSNMVKPEKFGHLHLVCHFTVPLSQKTDFVALFQRFFDYALFYPMSYAPIFCQMKDLMKIHNRGKFD